MLENDKGKVILRSKVIYRDLENTQTPMEIESDTIAEFDSQECYRTWKG